MSLSRVHLLILLLFTFILPIKTVAAEDLTSPNYKLVDPELAATSGETTSSNYRTLLTGQNWLTNTQISSSLYKIGSGQAYAFMANTPKIRCAETTTDQATTTCTALPTPITANGGMQSVCGEAGCYDRAKIEIDTQGNPADTLYIIEISTDNWTTVNVIDGNTRVPKPLISKSISDYKTMSAWEAAPWNSFNVLGLRPQTTYQVRLRALHGDFTETANSPTKSFTTASPTMQFDINIANAFNSSTNPPHVVNFGKILPGTISSTVLQNTVYVKLSTNVHTGALVFVSSANNGLYSNDSNYTIPSIDSLDLSSEISGFGAKISSHQAIPNTTFGIATRYNNGALNQIGSILSAPQLLMCSDSNATHDCVSGDTSWVDSFEARVDLLTKAAPNTPSVNDFSETITFTAIANW